MYRTNKAEMEERVRTGRNVVVLQGVSGSGKTRTAWQLFRAMPAGCMRRIFSADDQFTGTDGKYVFDGKQLAHAHACCLRRFLDHLMLTGKLKEPPAHGLLVVDNTNASPVEASPYMNLAKAYGWDAYLLTLEMPWADAHKRNVHDVPLDTCRNQYDRMQFTKPMIPEYWKHYIMESE